MNISLVVPVFNAESSLRELVSRMQPVLRALCKNYEVIFVNDGSDDGSWETITELAAEHTWICGIDLMRNYGQHNAVLCGIRTANHEIVVTLDDDLQHPPEEIPKLVGKLAEGYDVVYGTPATKHHRRWRNFASFITRWTLRSTLGSKVPEGFSAFRAFRREARDAFEEYHSPFVSVDVLLTWASTRFVSVEVQHVRRQFGTSTYTFRKLLSYIPLMITSYSALPLRFASLLGFGFTIFGFFVLIYVVGRYFILGGSIPGFPFLASTIAIFSGVQLFALGMIGEYLAQVHFRTMDRPVYTIRRTTTRS